MVFEKKINVCFTLIVMWLSVCVLCLFLAVPWVDPWSDPWSVIVEFPDHTHFCFVPFKVHKGSIMIK